MPYIDNNMNAYTTGVQLYSLSNNTELWSRRLSSIVKNVYEDMWKNVYEDTQ